jgi:hypothetical protein
MSGLLGKLKDPDSYDHPVFFIFFLVLVLIPVLALMNLGATKLGLPGPKALIGSLT